MGNPAAMVPNRICLLIASDRDGDALLAMVGKAKDVLMQESRPLGAEMLRQVDGKWVPWVPEGAVGATLRELQQLMRSQDYQAQKEVLDEATQRKGEDIFVASHTLVQSKAGAVLSYSVLSKGVATWLPRSDLVMIIQDPEAGDRTKPKVVEWSEFERLAGHLIEKLPYSLARYWVKEHPADDLVEKMALAKNFD